MLKLIMFCSSDLYGVPYFWDSVHADKAASTCLLNVKKLFIEKMGPVF